MPLRCQRGRRRSLLSVEVIRIPISLLGEPAVAHAHGGASIAGALQAGFDGIEHCTFVTAEFVDCDWATIEALARSGIVVSVAEAHLPSEPGAPPSPGGYRRY